MIELLFQKSKVYHVTSDGLYHEYNQWTFCDYDHNWFVRFLRHNFPENKKRINFFGPVGNPLLICNKFEGPKIFYTPEDVEHKFTKLWLYYRDYRIDYVDLAMGFGIVDSPKYIRFPYWILTTFEPEFTDEDIAKRVKEINNYRPKKSKDCVLVCGHDPKKTREMILSKVEKILQVDSAGKWRNNTRDLWDKYDNDKIAYMSNFRFNICAENDNTENYVTEKIFDAFLAGCVPIYYGSNNNPEPGLINKDALIFWNKDGDNKDSLALIKELNSNTKAYDEFVSQTRLNDETAEYVIERFNMLRDSLKKILE